MFNTRAFWRLAETVAVFILYLATARIGFLAAIPPGNVTIIWPPSGIAVAAMLLLGYRASVGIWLGSFVVNYCFLQSDTSLLSSVATSAIIAFGSSCQAALISWLMRHRYGNTVFVGHYAKIPVFTLIVMLCCLIAATTGTGSLLVSGIINDDAFASTWQAWWFGDVFGILVVTPIIQVAVYFIQHKHEPSHAAALALSCGMGFSLLVFITVWNLETQKITEQFKNISQVYMTALEEMVSFSERDLAGIVGLFNASDEVSRREFHSFIQAHSNLTASKGIQALEPGKSASKPVSNPCQSLP